MPTAHSPWLPGFRTEHQEPQRLVHAYYWGNSRAHFEINIVPARIRGTIVTETARVNAASEGVLGDGVWHHVAMSRDVDGVVSLYIDGALGASATGAIGSVSQHAMGRANRLT